MFRKTTKLFQAKYAAGDAETRDYLLTTSATGRRVIAFHWLQDDVWELRAVRGDGRKPEFEVLARETLHGLTWEDVPAHAERLAAAWLA